MPPANGCSLIMPATAFLSSLIALYQAYMDAASVVRSGMFIPVEMTKGQTAAAFDKGAASVMATTVVSRLGALLP